MTPHPSLLRQYRAGASEHVWRLLSAQGNLPADDPEAWEIATDTMAKALRNVERIVDFLDSAGYAYGFNADMPVAMPQPHSRPDDTTSVAIDRLERSVGTVPISLRAWWSVVGSVFLVGYFPRLESATAIPYADPLTVFGPGELLSEVEETSEASRSGSSRLGISPDIFTKSNVSGGLPYEIETPDGSADPLLMNVMLLTPAPAQSGCPWLAVESSETFVEYLRRSFMWAGFPGLAFRGAKRAERISGLVGAMERL